MINDEDRQGERADRGPAPRADAPWQTGDRSLGDALAAMPPGDADRVRRLLVGGGWVDPWELTTDEDGDP